MYFKYKIHADRQLPFLSTVENVITVFVHSVKQSSEHTTQSLQFCYKPLTIFHTQVGRQLGWQLLLIN